ncbi:MAG: methylmalonyl-CoA mutase [Candidatus Rokubacteria bacterium 13_1_40CM_69_27]|nr:MAG: methylmalonyl-CoA mutase [Candidatus Rokubacteria bacterium 13_1_40CM_69_27]OLE37752.1 MAG: methylmalonyl-CoA mutase [Candidatus Rokubacteria bacterium 13_1_20CM_2_70_7]
MFDPEAIERAAARRRQWEASELREFLARQPEGRAEYRTASGLPVKRVYGPEDIAATPFEEIDLPGHYPFTRGPYPTMYRGRLWTMRQIAGFGTGHDTNRRFRYLIAQGQTGLSVDFDMPTLMGYDSDDPRALGEVGREGVAIDTIEDMEALFEGIDLERISVSMTINPTAWILLAMYVALAEARGYDAHRLSGTTQADILKEYVAQKEWIFPIRSSLRLVRDMIVFSAERMARYNPINISGYHISEAGATSVQEVAFTMANAIAYIEEVTAAGVPVDAFAPRLAFYFVAQADFFEEVAKFRAARRIWAKLVKERFGATRPESMRLRFHCQTAAATLTKAQPLTNIVRTALQALSAVLGGAQSLHTNGLDEAYAIPSEQAMKIALRTQQIIAEETRVPNVADPLGGSYYVEALTNQFEAAVFEILGKVDAMGGTVKAIEEGYFQREIAESAYDFARRKASGEETVIGVNKYVEPSEPGGLEIHRVDQDVEARQIERLRSVLARRDVERVAALLDRLEREAQEPSVNLMPVTIELVRARASLGEIVARLRRVWGTYVERPVF